MEADGEHNTRGTANTVTDGQRLDQLEDMVRELYRHVVGNEYSEGETPGPSGNFSNASMGFGANVVREIYRHVVSNGYSERETPGPTGNFSNASMSFGANAVDEEFAVENAIDEKSMAKNVVDALASKREVASDEKSVAKSAVAEESAAKNAIDEKSIVTTPKDASDEESGVTGGNANTVTVDIDQRLNRLEDLMGEVVKLLGNKQPGRDNLGERDVSKALEISSANTPDNGSSVDGASVNSGDQEKSL